ncbi:MAG: hypothetical protein EOP67_15210, partial [Sphingomonas sp.]
MKKVSKLSIDSLMVQTRNAGVMQAPSLAQTLADAPLTVVVVPGVFAEFIKVRAFEGAFSPRSAYAKQFAQILAKASAEKKAAELISHFNPPRLAKCTPV